MADGLDGKENIAAADGVAVAQDLGGLLGGFFQSAAGREIIVGVGFGAHFRELRPFHETFDGTEIPRFGVLSPPWAVAPAAAARAGVSGVCVALLGGFLTALDYE